MAFQIDPKTDPKTVKASLTTYKGHLTRIIKENDVLATNIKERNVFSKVMETQCQTLSQRLKKTFDNIEHCYECLKLLEPAKTEQYQEGLDEQYERYLEANDVCLTAYDKVVHAREAANLQVAKQNVDNVVPSVPRIASDLKPPILDDGFGPIKFQDWIESVAQYFKANNLLDNPPANQISYLKPLISHSMWARIQPEINMNVPVVVLDDDDSIIFNNDSDERKTQWTTVDVLMDEFERKYPLQTRQIEFLDSKQGEKQSSLGFVSEVIRRADNADYRKLTPETLLMRVITKGLKKEDVRLEILKEGTLGRVNNVNDIQNIIRNLETAEKASSYMATGKNDSSAFKMSAYKKNQRESRSSRGSSHHQPHHRSHSRGRSFSRGRGRGRSSGGYRGRGGRGGRGRGRGRSHHRGWSNDRFQSPSPTRGHSSRRSSFDAGKYCSFHKVKGHSDRECNSQKKKHYDRGRSQSRQTKTDSDDDSELELAVTHLCRMTQGNVSSKHTPRLNMKFIQKVTRRIPREFSFPVVPDSGSTKTVVSADLAKKQKLKLESSKGFTLKNASNEKMKLIGVVNMIANYKGRKLQIHALVSPDLKGEEILLSWHDMEKLGIIQLSNEDQLRQMVAENKDLDLEEMKEEFIKNYPDVLTDVLPDKPINVPPVSFHIDEKKAKEVKPVRTTVARMRPVNLEERCHQDVLEKVRKKQIRKVGHNEVSEDIHPGFHVLKPNGEPRLITDLTGLNRKLYRQVQPFTPATDLIKQLDPEANYNCKMDFLHGFHQLRLDEKSQKMTTFLLPEGRFQYLVLPMGASSSPDIFISVVKNILKDLPVLMLVDDVLIQDKTKAGLKKKIEAVLQRCREFNCALSKKKFELSKSVSFAGHIVTPEGIKADPAKIEAIQNFPQPKNVTDLRAYMGLINQLGHFFPDLSQIALPLRPLLKKNVIFNWTDEFQKAFEDTKKYLLSPPVLTPYDKKKKLTLFCDASTLGYGYCLVQGLENGKLTIVACGSRSLGKNEQNWGITDLELGAIDFAVSKCYYYLRGVDFQIMSDHLPLKKLFDKGLQELSSPRQLRLRKRLMTYSFRCGWIKGKNNVLADLFSRFPVWSYEEVKAGMKEDEDGDPDEEYLTANISRFLQIDDGMEPYLHKLIEAAEKDTDYQKVLKELSNGRKTTKGLCAGHPAKKFQSVWHELSRYNGLIILDGQKIVVPKSYQEEILRRAHLYHPGIVRMKQLLRSLFWWNGMSSQAENYVNLCEQCQTNQDSNRQQIISPIDVKAAAFPMSTLAMDVLTYDKTDYLSVCDRFSGFSWCLRIKGSTTTEAITKRLDKIFMENGFCQELQSDNAPIFASQEMDDFCTQRGITQVFTSPLNSSSNGLPESFVKIHKRILKKTSTYQDFLYALMEQRNTPREDGISAAELFYGKRQRTFLPILSSQLSKMVENRHEIYKNRISKATDIYSRRGGSSLSTFQKGQLVRVQNEKTKKWNKIGKITDLNPRKSNLSSNMSYEIEVDGKKKIRNRKFLRLVKSNQFKDSLVSNSRKHLIKEDHLLSPPDHQDHQRDECEYGKEHLFNSKGKRVWPTLKQPPGKADRPRRSPRLRKVRWADTIATYTS